MTQDSMQKQNNTAPAAPSSFSMIATAAIFFSLGFLIAYIMFSDATTTSGEDERIAAAVQGTFIALTPTATPPPTPVPMQDTLTDFAPVQGDINAPIKMVEFTSYTCEFCGRFRRDTLPALQEHYGDMLVFVTRDFPRSEPEIVLNIASQCAHDQDNFWAFSNQFWENQVAEDPLAIFDEQTILTFATNADLDLEQFNTCRENEDIEAQVLIDRQDGRGFGVSGTPTFFINGQRVVGSKHLIEFMDIIDAELRSQGITPPSRL